MFVIWTTYQHYSNRMDILDDHTVALILSCLPAEELRKLHRISIRIFRIVIGNIHLRYQLYESWKDAVNADDIQALDIFDKSGGIPNLAFNMYTALKSHVPKLSIVKYLHQKGYDWDVHTCANMAAHCPLEYLMYAHENGCEWDASTCMYAAMYGRLDCLIYASEHGCERGAFTCLTAAANGHLNCLQYAHEHGCEWGASTCMYAAMHGHLDCLMYASEHGCDWDVLTCVAAAMTGNLNCLQYAHEHGCKWDAHVCSNAVKRGSLECLIYARENGCEWDLDECIAVAIVRKSDKCLQYLQQFTLSEELVC